MTTRRGPDVLPQGALTAWVGNQATGATVDEIAAGLAMHKPAEDSPQAWRQRVANACGAAARRGTLTRDDGRPVRFRLTPRGGAKS